MYKDNKQKIVATIEARMTSTRLPGKVLLPLAGKPALERIIERLRRSKYLDEIIVATTINDFDNPVVELAQELGVKFYRGSEEDVLGRVLNATQSVKGDIVVEVTGDCPLVDWRLIDRGIEEFFENDVDYASNIVNLSYPIGLDVQVFKIEALVKADREVKDQIERTHVSYYIYNHPEIFNILNWAAEKECTWPDLRLTLDEKDDYLLLSKIYEKIWLENEDFSYKDIIKFLRDNSNLLNINKNVRRKSPTEG
ncbi:MAG: glycosyltransferase family protein [Patescibacteria group bacterium]